MPLAVLENCTPTTLLRIGTNLNLLVMKVCLDVGTHVRALGISSLLIVLTVLILHRSNLYRQCQLDRRVTCIMVYVYDWYDLIIKLVTAQKIPVATSVVFFIFGSSSWFKGANSWS